MWQRDCEKIHKREGNEIPRGILFVFLCEKNHKFCPQLRYSGLNISIRPDDTYSGREVRNRGGIVHA